MCGATASMKSPNQKMEATDDCRGSEDVEVQKQAPIPRHLWVMNGAVMFGREFCYAMETALVTPVLLRIGLPEQYYSLTWFLSPVLGLFFTPLIGSTSDRCTLRWGRRRPFILALCVGVLLGETLFLNGALIGLSVGDSPGSQPIGIGLTVFGVIVLDFCADAADGPIRAYLLDVADTEEQDMALNIHSFSAGLGGAVGYMLSGLDWTGTALGQAFKAQEQVLFLFTGIVFIVSVTLHLFSIPEQPFSPQPKPEIADSDSQTSVRLVDRSVPTLDVIKEESSSEDDSQSNSDREELDLLPVERVRSKSDSVLAMPDATIELDPDLHPDNQHFLLLADVDHLPDVHEDLENAFKPIEKKNDVLEDEKNSAATSPLVLEDATNCNNGNLPKDCKNGSADSHLLQSSTVKSLVNEGISTSNGYSPPSNIHKSLGSPKLGSRHPSNSRARRPTFYRQPSFTFSYYGRVRPRFRLRRNTGTTSSPRPITSSRSLNDLTELQKQSQERQRKLSSSSRSSDESSASSEAEEGATLRLLWLSMLKMPTQLWRLCICHLLAWFSYIAQAVFFTDYMGQVIFQGDPIAPVNSTEQQNYLKGVQMGCWGLVIYAATSSVCSVILQKYLDHFDLSIRIIYSIGTLSFSIGTAVMAIVPNVYFAMVMISTMGVISMSISYCPYALLGQYHELEEYIYHSPANTKRGFGIDCAILTCQVYISQILVASVLGAVVDAVGSVRVIPVMASGGSFLSFLAACFLVIYPDLEQNQDTSEDQNEQQDTSLALVDLTNQTQSEETVERPLLYRKNSVEL